MSKSNDYWRKREEEALQHYISEEREYDKQLKKIYGDMLSDCQTQIDSFYGKYARAEGISISEAKRRVSSLDIAAYERKAKRYVEEKDFSKTANKEMRLYNATMKINRLEMLKTNIGLELISGHDKLDRFMNGVLKGRTEAELARQAGILGKSVRDNSKLANSIVNASFHNANFSQRVWANQSLLQSRLNQLLQTGLIQGKNPRVLARELQKTFNSSVFDSERLMRTELARVQVDAQLKSFEENGFTHYEFIANSGCCDACQGLNGKHFEVKKAMPGENTPPIHPHCRCSVAAWEDDKDYEAWLDFLDKGGTTKEWNKGLKINSPSSIKSYRRSLKDIAEGKAGLDKRRSGILNSLANSGEYRRYEKETISIRDLAYLSAASNVEFALFRSKSEDIIVRGTARDCNIIGDLGEDILKHRYEWVAHSHVDRGKLVASPEDRETLKKLKQKKSILVGIDGQEQKFHQSEFDG